MKYRKVNDLMIKETSLCMGCMNDKTYDGPCRLCGYTDDTPCIPAYLPPKTFLAERYIIGKLLSYNGEGAVYIGFDTATGTKVTVKEFMPDTLCSRKKGETEITVNPGMMPLYKTYLSEFADLNHSLMKSRGMAHIQTVLDIFNENGTCYTVFEYINGISLKTYLANSGRELSWEQVKELFPPILTTLSLVHSAGIIHRGISPSTIFVTDKMELKLAGFAISAARTTNTEIACEMFTGYAAPEQYIANEANGTWTDVYGISAVLYRVLTATTPQEAIARTPGSMPEPMMIDRDVPANVSRVIMQGMRLSTESRIKTITEFVDMLFASPSRQGADGGRPTTKQQERRLKKQKKERAKTIAVLCAAGVVLIAFAVVFAMTLSGAFAPKTVTSSNEDTPPATSSTAPVTKVTTTASEPQSEPEIIDEANIVLPNFINRRYDQILSRYDSMFTFVTEFEYTEDYSADFVYEQTPEAGTMVSEGEQVIIKVSKGKSIVPLPEYKDMTLDKYIAELDKLNIKYSIKPEKTNEVPDGCVARCSKKVDDLVNVKDGETITVFVAKNFTEEAPEPDTQDTEEETKIPEGIPIEP